MTLLQRISREPSAILGVIVAGYGVLVAFHVLALTASEVGAITAFGGAAVFALRWLTTPSAEVVAQLKPGRTTPVAGPASPIVDGKAVHVLPAVD